MLKNEPNLFEIEYKKSFPFVQVSLKNFFAIFLEAVFIGILAFIMETVVDMIYVKYIIDQGVLCGPFIPMYAVVLFIALLTIKTPKRSIKNFGIVFGVLFVGITLIELVVGFALEWIVGEQLWDYSTMLPLSWKYISVVASLFWGVGGAVYYFYLVPVFKKISDLITENLDRYVIMGIISTIFLTDIIVTFTRIAKNGGFKMLYCIKLNPDLMLFIGGIVFYIAAVAICGVITYLTIRCFIGKKLKWLYIAIYTFMCILPAFSAYNYLNRHTGAVEVMAIMGFLSCGFLIYYALSGVVLFIVRLIVLKASKREIFGSEKMKGLSTFCAMGLSILVCLIGVICLKCPKTIHLSCGSGNSSMKIVAVSDVHYGTCGGIVKLEDCVDDINKLHPDLVLFLGDTVDISVEQMDKEYFYTQMDRIQSTYGVYAIGGNHEYENNGYTAVYNLFKDSSCELLLDKEVIIDNKVRIIGRLDYVFSSRKSIDKISSDSTLPLIVLDHQPQAYQEAKDANAILMLSGHTHNGQLWPGDIFVNLYHRAAFHNPVTNGLYKDGNFQFYVTSGYGGWGFPMKTVGRSQILEIEYKY